MNWQAFRPHSTKGMTVSLSRHHITMSPDVAEKLNADKVILYYNDKEGKIKMQKAENEGYKVTKGKVLVKRFREHFNIDAKGQYACVYDAKEQAVVISLD